MVKLGVNTVLFGGHDLETALKHIAWAGYDGAELSALGGSAAHVPIDDDGWEKTIPTIKSLLADYDLLPLSMEECQLDEDRVTKGLAACQAIGAPVMNVGPGGSSGSDEDFERQTDHLAKMAEKAETYGVALCVKAHVGCCIDDTPTTLRAMKKIKSPAFGIDMDPSHVHRAGENPAEALAPVLSRVKHIHIRDCKGRQRSPGEPCDQACGRGDIDLHAYFKVMVDGGYDGPCCLEVIGADKYDLSRQAIVAAESYGYMNACLKALGGR